MTCQNCGHSVFPWEYRTWLGNEPCFWVSFPMNVLHVNEQDVEMFGPRVACHWAERWMNMYFPEGDLFLRDRSQRRKVNEST